MKQTAILGAALAILAGTAQAETMMTKGKGIGQADLQVMQMSETHMIMHTNTAYSSYEMESADDPLQGMSGPCFGSIEMLAGAVSGGGHCAFTHESGDMAAIRWTATGMNAEGAIMGSWDVTGGTGAWVGATGGGGFVSMTNPETGVSENAVEGQITLN